MPESLSRRSFAGLAAGASLAAAIGRPGASRAASSDPLPLAVSSDARLGGALILGGGGARGAYEAGVIEAIRRRAGVADGEPIPGIDVVCGSSIGALNAWFVATAQYSKLAQLWHDVASEDVFAIKRQYRATTSPGAFIIVKIVQALSLVRGLGTNVRGVLDGDRVRDWIARNVDPLVPLVVPFTVTVTNLDRSRAEIFYASPVTVDAATRAAAIARIHVTSEPTIAVRAIADGTLRSVLQASSAIPALFDPIEMPAPEGTVDRYIDGGIADNDPIDTGRALAKAIYGVIVDPLDRPRQPYKDAISIIVGSFGITQTIALETSLWQAYVVGARKRLLEAGRPSGEQRRILDAELDADLSIVQPQTEPAVRFVEFDRQAKIDATYRQGVADGAAGWRTYAPPPTAGGGGGAG